MKILFGKEKIRNIYFVFSWTRLTRLSREKRHFFLLCEMETCITNHIYIAPKILDFWFDFISTLFYITCAINARFDLLFRYEVMFFILIKDLVSYVIPVTLSKYYSQKWLWFLCTRTY